MTDKDAAVKQVRAALEFDTRINLHRHPIQVTFDNDAVVLEGEVDSVAAKKLALEHAGAVRGIRGVVDRLRVAPAERRGDGAIRDALAAMLASQRELANCGIRVGAGNGTLQRVREAPAEKSGDIDVHVDNGVITIEGSVISLSHKRVIGTLAWWTPGCRDVINSLEIDPPERDGDEEVIEALTLVYEMDPMVQTDLIRVRCDQYVVTLEGYARTEQEKQRAEFDAWSLFGVDKVVNRIMVRT
ncbi:MAG TPA: BON domain-containing protein [Casimicrobiaceae bacterium]|nr:BON domain-containing protein [Casimicrobiaceae bacterium]